MPQTFEEIFHLVLTLLSNVKQVKHIYQSHSEKEGYTKQVNNFQKVPFVYTFIKEFK